MVFCDNGRRSNLSQPAYGENESPSILPMGALEGGGASDRGLEPESGLPNSIHDSRSSISWSSVRRFCLTNCRFWGLELGLRILGLGFL